MASPDDLTRLKARVEVYESELQDAQKLIQNVPQSRSQMEAIIRVIEVNQKLLVAYREYCQELEKLVPR